MLLGIDIGGTKVALALADAEGGILARMRRPTESTFEPEKDLARLVDDCRRLLGEGGVRVQDVRAAGVSVPGPLDTRRGVVMHPPNLPGWREVPIGEWLTRELGCPVRLENDANAAALAEWRFGAGRGLSDVVYLTMSTGVGAGLILNGRVYRGQDGTAGEMGHIPVEWDGERCRCGLRGCLEAYVGGAAWTRRLRREAPTDCRAAEIAGGRQALLPEHIVDAASQGDAHALAEISRFNEYLARSIVQIRFGLAPQAVVLGTIAAAAGEALCLGPVRSRVEAQSWAHQAPHMQILAAELGEDLPYLAGVSVALDAIRTAPD